MMSPKRTTTLSTRTFSKCAVVAIKKIIIQFAETDSTRLCNIVRPTGLVAETKVHEVCLGA